jgi:hypothetical protein
MSPRLSALDAYQAGASLRRKAGTFPAGSRGRAWCVQNARDCFAIARQYRRRLPRLAIA